MIVMAPTEVRRRSETGTLEITEEDIVGWTTKS